MCRNHWTPPAMEALLFTTCIEPDVFKEAARISILHTLQSKCGVVSVTAPFLVGADFKLRRI